MSLNKVYFDQAKECAANRLKSWIDRVKEENKPQIIGIPRLRNEFRGLFKKIEWKPRHIRTLAREWKEDNEEDEEIRDETNLDGENKFAELRSPGSFPWNLQLLEDQRLCDSNSSNLSSRLEHSDEIGKHSAHTPSYSRTPIAHTPLSQGEKADEDDEAEDDINSEENFAMFRATRGRARRVTITAHDKTFQPLLHFKRRRKRRTKKESIAALEEIPTALAEGLGIGLEESVVVPPLPAIKQKSSMHVLDVTRPRSSKTSIKVNFKKGAPVEFSFRRTARSLKPFKMRRGSSQDMTDAEPREHASVERRAVILNNFRRVVRLLIHVRVLLNVSRLRIEEEEKIKAFKRIEGDCELSFDLSMYKTAFTYGVLTARIQRALKKNPGDRNEEDARMLMEVMLRMPVFIKYPKNVKQSLAKQMWYDCFHNGRVIVKQGDPGSRMYFVVSGEVDLKRTDVSTTGEANSYHLKTLSAGATFGEIALIRDMRREFTAVCKGTSEFLSLSKMEFNNALRHRWEQECNVRFSFLRSCDLFDSWTDKQLQHLSDSSELKEYNDNKVILGDVDCLTESVHLIRKGHCDVVRRIAVHRHQSPYLRPELYLTCTARRRQDIAAKTYCKSRRVNQKEVHFLIVTTLHPGNFFGAGENLTDTFILSRGKTECIVVNSAQFSIQGKSEQLRTLARERDLSLPSNKSLNTQFQVNRKWYEYRNKVVKEVYSKKTMNHKTSFADVPRTIMNEPRIPDDLIHYN